MDYNTNFKSAGQQASLYAPDAFRASDHDPVVVSVNLTLDSDSDGLDNTREAALGTNPLDADSDDDGLADGQEDANHNGVVDGTETDPRNADSDGDGVQDGTELGLTAGVADADGNGPLLGTNLQNFVADADPTRTTSALDPDSDADGYADGNEDVNRNGRVDGGESDPSDANSVPAVSAKVPSFPAPVLTLALVVFALLGLRQLNARSNNQH